MEYVVLDLEWNIVRRKSDRPEITEIGAVKVKDIDGLTLLGAYFHSYVKPSFSSVNKRTKKLTGLTVPDIWLAPKFPKVIERYKRWVKGGKQILCTWSDNDIEVLLKNCNYHNADKSWLQRYIDLQQEITHLYRGNNSRVLGLKKALRITGLKFKGNHHSAIDDAVNTARLFRKEFDRLELKVCDIEAYKKNRDKRKINKNKKYKEHIHKLYQKRMDLGIGRSQLAEFSEIDLIKIAKIERLKEFATKYEMHSINQTLDLLSNKSLKTYFSNCC